MKFHHFPLHSISILIILILSISIGVWFRVQNLSLLEGQYLVGSDSYRHLRHIRQVVEDGSLLKVDTMRHAPLGRDNTVLPTFFSWAFAQIFKIIHRVFPQVTLIDAAILYPVFTSALIFIIFFFFVRRLFDTTTALFSVLILATLPAFISRTIAGYTDQDPITILLYLVSLYFYIQTWQCQKVQRQICFAFSSGVIMGILGLIWPGTGVLILIILLFHLLRLWRGEFSSQEARLFYVWSVPILFILLFLTKVYTANFAAPYSIIALGTPILFLSIITIFLILTKKTQAAWYLTVKGNIPFGLSISLGTFLLIAVGCLLLFGTTWMHNLIERVFYPFGKNPVMKYVGELHRPYWTDWWREYGSFSFLTVAGIGLLCYQVGFNRFVSRFISFISLIAWITGTVLSRSFPNTILDGNSTLSHAILIGSSLLFLFGGSIVALSLELASHSSGHFHPKKIELNKANLLLLVWFLIGFALTRSGQRFNLILSPAAAIAGSFCLVKLYRLLLPSRGIKLQLFFLFLTIFAWQLFFCQSDLLTFLLQIVSLFHFSPSFSLRLRLVITLFITFLFLGPSIQDYLIRLKNKLWVFRSLGGLAAIILLTLTPFVGPYGFAQKSYIKSQLLAPFPDSEYRKAIEWLKFNTPSNAVIAAWWDLGSSINELGGRSTVIDEEQIFPWVHLMARYVICAQTEREALEFLKTHSVTHLLLSQREISLLNSISEVGSDKTLDRLLPIVHLVPKHNHFHDKMQFTPKELTFLDKSLNPIHYLNKNLNRTIQMTGISVSFEWKDGYLSMTQPPQVTLFDGKEQRVVTIQELVLGEKSWYFPQGELNGCLWIKGSASDQSGRNRFVVNQAVLLSKAARNSLITKLFFNEQSESFQLIYQSRSDALDVRIWEIHYPDEIQVNSIYLRETDDS